MIVAIVACSTTQNNPAPTPDTPAPTPTFTPEPTPEPTPETPPDIPPEIIDTDVPDGVMIEYLNYNIHKVSDDALFKLNGEVNLDVLESLLEILNDPRLDPLLREPKTTWSSGLDYDGYSFTEVTAEDFSSFVVPRPASMSNSGAIVIKLFETVPGQTGVHNMHLTEFTSQWWQLVYRAADDDNDVLTLWMMQPYRVTPFNGTRYDSGADNTGDRFLDRMRDRGDSAWSMILLNNINTVLSDERISLGQPPSDEYFFEGNYSESIARNNLLRDTGSIPGYFNIDDYIVAPSGLPGLWQSSVYQTGTNMSDKYYVTDSFFSTGSRWRNAGSYDAIEGLGAAGIIWGDHRFFSLINGMDGISVGPSGGNWPNTSVLPVYDDLFWLPSDFETRSMGFDKDSARNITFLRNANNRSTALRENRAVEAEEAEAIEVNEDDEDDEENDNIEEQHDTGRSGLWRLNGFDRAFDQDGLGLPRGWMTQQVWLRSQFSLGIGNSSVVTHTGNQNNGYGVHQLAGMRPAVHLSISQLEQLIIGVD